MFSCVTSLVLQSYTPYESLRRMGSQIFFFFIGSVQDLGLGLRLSMLNAECFGIEPKIPMWSLIDVS